MMECKDIQERLSAYLEGAVSPEDRKTVEKHLESCRVCGAAIQDLQKSQDLVKDLEEVESPPWLTQKIMARVKAEEERKKGLFRKLFYPLHIKVPIEAFAMVLIAVVAVYVFRAVEPDMQRAQLTAPAGPTLAREEGPKPSQELAADSPAPRAKPRLEDHPPAVTGQLSKALPAEKTFFEEKREALPERYSEGMATADSLRKQEFSGIKPASPPLAQERERPALSEPAKDAWERNKLAAVPSPLERAMKRRASIDIMVRAKEASLASRKVEDFLGRLGAQRIERESREGREVLTAELKRQYLQEFLEELKAIGEIKEKEMPPDIPGGAVAIRVEIVSNP